MTLRGKISSVTDVQNGELFSVTKQLDNLLIKFMSPENADGQFISDEEYQAAKNRFLKIKAILEAGLTAQGKEMENWMVLSEKTFDFARFARIYFEHGTMETKRAIVRTSENVITKREIGDILSECPGLLYWFQWKAMIRCSMARR